MLLSQFKNTLIIVLLVATALSGVLGHEVEAIAIGVIILLAVLLGFIQEYRAERALEALREMAAPLAVVLRDGLEKEIPARELVPGDVVIIVTGDRIPADARLIEAVNLKIEESALTGESLSVGKHGDVTCSEDAAVGDRRNMVFTGTSVTYGRGRAVVVATGMQTEFGRIAGMLSGMKRETTPLQKSLDRVGKTLTKAAFAVVAVIVVLGVLRGQPLLEMFVFGIALAVAVVPEALPAVVTISLAIGVQRMARRHALVRSLPAVETLGCTTVICSDKTGTLTKDEMTVRRIVLSGRLSWRSRAAAMTRPGRSLPGKSLFGDRRPAPDAASGYAQFGCAAGPGGRRLGAERRPDRGGPGSGGEEGRAGEGTAGRAVPARC